MDMDEYLESKIALKYKKALNEKKTEEPIPVKKTNASPTKPPNTKNYNKKEPKILDMDIERFLSQIALDGIVFNETEARENMCTCAKTPKGTLYCFKKGIIGALSQSQIEEYCPPSEQETAEFSKINEKTVDEISKINSECSLDNTKDLRDRFKCIYNLAEREKLI
jgi:hypothetical protein